LDKVKFLLVDDIEDNLVALEALLRRDGLETLKARSGTEALELLLTNEVALAFIDVQMPGMDGFELAELMRGAERSKNIPIIFVTAGAHEPNRIFRGYESGAVDFLFKPIDPLILRHKANTFYQLFRQRQQLSEQLQRIQQNEALLRAMMDSTSAVIYIKDIDGRYQKVNKRFEELLKRPAEQLCGLTDHDLFSPSVADQLRANDRRVFQRGEVLHMEETIETGGFDQVYITSKVPLRDAAGKIWALCGISTDISEQKRMEANLAQAVQTRDDVLAVVSHDLRNPLNVINLTISVLLKLKPELRAEREPEIYETLRRSVAQMNRMIGDLVDTVSLRANRLSVHKQVHAADAIVDEALSLQAAAARQRGVELRWDRRAPNVEVLCDRVRVLQVLANLIGNALKFSAPDDSISVSVEEKDSEVLLSVADSGSGIAPDDLPHVFNPYWSGKAHQRAGTGLGLYISKGIIEAHGGRISLESTVGQGTTVYVTLPRAPEPGDA
jgi:PAS domain S-box-containing protein